MGASSLLLVCIYFLFLFLFLFSCQIPPCFLKLRESGEPTLVLELSWIGKGGYFLPILCVVSCYIEQKSNMLRLMSLLSGPDLAMAFASKLINGTLHVGLFLSLNCDNRFEQLIFLSVYANLLPVATCYYFQPRMSCSASFIQFIIVIIIIICKAVLRNVCSDFGTCNLKNDPLLSIQYVDRMSIH